MGSGDVMYTPVVDSNDKWLINVTGYWRRRTFMISFHIDYVHVVGVKVFVFIYPIIRSRHAGSFWWFKLTRILSSRIDQHTHAGSAWPWPFDLNACRAPVTQRTSTKFDVDSSSRFSFRARIHTHARTQTHKATDATDHPTQASVGVDRKSKTIRQI